MKNRPLPDVDNSAELRACLRDLVGLLGLPALWSSREPEATVRLLTETLVETLALDACGVTTIFAEKKEPVRFFYAGGHAIHATKGTAWLPFIEASSKEHHELIVTEEATPIGELRVARFSLGYYGYKGQITAASSRHDFPKQTELLLLRSAASLAAGGLRTARLTYERERALRAKDEFLAMLGHELRNPLAPIVTTLEFIRLKTAGELSREHMVIERQVNHLKRLVDDLLDVTRITAGKIELKHEALELHAVALAALEAAHPLIEQRQHHLLYEIPSRGLLIRGDLVRLTQVVSNLLVNAAKYTEPGGKINISACRNGDEVRLTVKDNGHGISPDLLPHVFDLFEQGDVSLDRSRGGLGLGLSIVRSLVAMHGGTVTAESNGIGCGSTFTVTLPVTEGEPVNMPDRQRQTTVQVNKAERILIVDDNRDAADGMGALLEAHGYEVHVRYTPLDALSACKKMTPTIVIVDIGLPIISGYELANLIRSRFKNMPPRIMAVTGYGQPLDQQRSFSAGIEAHLTKPVSIDTLLTHIERAGLK